MSDISGAETSDRIHEPKIKNEDQQTTPDYGIDIEGESNPGLQLIYAVKDMRSTLDYEPFDVKDQLKAVGTMPSQPSDRLPLVKEIRLKHEAQLRGITRVIHELYVYIHRHPDAHEIDLMCIVSTYAPTYQFTKDQLYRFYMGIEAYVRKHNRIENVLEQHPDPQDLYEYCFGRKPRDRVSVVQRPMTLHFVCCNDDYVYAYHQPLEGAQITDDQHLDALGSLGAAHYILRHRPELNGIVTLERMPPHMQNMSENHFQIVRSETRVPLDAIRSDINLSAGAQAWTISHSLRSVYIRLGNGPSAQVLYKFDFKLDHDTNEIVLEDAIAAEKPQSPNKRIALTKDDYICGYINITTREIIITPVDDQIFSLAYISRYLSTEPIDTQTFNSDTMVHEEQHQFNQLYIPLYEPVHASAIILEAAASSNDTNEIVTQLLRRLAVAYRHMSSIDLRAKDEILAQYMGGKAPQHIWDIMLNVPGYQYMLTLNIEDTSRYLHDKLNALLSSLEDIFDRDGQRIDPESLRVSISQVEQHVTYAFNEGYRRDLGKWVNAIELLEDHGYSREKIVALLYYVPINEWARTARRLTKASPQAAQ